MIPRIDVLYWTHTFEHAIIDIARISDRKRSHDMSNKKQNEGLEETYGRKLNDDELDNVSGGSGGEDQNKGTQPPDCPVSHKGYLPPLLQ